VDISILIYAVIALAGVAIGWLISSYQHAQRRPISWQSAKRWSPS
jgi:DNA recombination protein RmuC